MGIALSPYKGENPLAGLWNFMTKRSAIEINKQADVENVLSFLASKHIDTIAKNALNLNKNLFGKSN